MLDANPTKRFRGAVKEIGQRVNRSKATVPVKIEFVDRVALATKGAGKANGKDSGSDNGSEDARVLPDMAARVSFLTETLDPKSLDTPPKLVVPPRAIAPRAGGDVVFIVEDGELRMTAVKLGPAFADGRELVTNIPAGTKVVLDPPSDLADGQEVKENKR